MTNQEINDLINDVLEKDISLDDKVKFILNNNSIKYDMNIKCKAFGAFYTKLIIKEYKLNNDLTGEQLHKIMLHAQHSMEYYKVKMFDLNKILAIIFRSNPEFIKDYISEFTNNGKLKQL